MFAVREARPTPSLWLGTAHIKICRARVAPKNFNLVIYDTHTHTPTFAVREACPKPSIWLAMQQIKV